MQKEVPILFQTEMVEAILAGRKTMTRRLNTKIQPGDIIWVKETWVNLGHNNCQDGAEQFNTVVFRAGQNGKDWESNIEGWRWKPSLFMPKSACRIWLKCTDRREEHLHEISDEDAMAEGILSYKDDILGRRYKDYMAPAKGYGHPDVDYPSVSTPFDSFGSLWEKINGIESLIENPELSVIKFEVLSTMGKPNS